MNEKSTTDLLNIFDDISPADIDSFINENSNILPNKNIFFEYMSSNNISAASVVNACNGYISKSYVYDILSGNKTNPSRDIVLVLCIALHMNKKMTRRLLENYNHRDLYLKDPRDIIIATYINTEIYNIDEINDELSKYSLPLFATNTQ